MAYGTSTAATVSQEIQGFNNEKCSLWYSVLYRQTRQPVSSPNEVYFLTPESQDDRSDETFGVATPSQPGAYILHVMLRDPNGTELAWRESYFNVN